MSSPDRIRPNVLITGASSGIGAEFAHICAREGYDLILVARRRDRLEGVAGDADAKFGSRALIIDMDLTEPGACAQLGERVASSGRHVDVLINNAGIGVNGDFVTRPAERQLEMVDINVRALTDLTAQFLPGMAARSRGGVINVASTAAFQPGPGMATYFATKAFVKSFSEALSEEMRGTGVTITALCPGKTHTEFFRNTDDFKFASRAPGMSAAKVAEAGWAAFRAGRRTVVAGTLNRAQAAAVSMVPKPALLRAGRLVLK